MAYAKLLCIFMLRLKRPSNKLRLANFEETPMKYRTFVLLTLTASLSGCALLDRAWCVPQCQSQAQNSSSLVSFLYPDGKLPPTENSVPELRIPLRVGLAFLPSRSSAGAAQLEAAQKEMLLEKIRARFVNRKFVSEIVIIPDHYLMSSQGFAGLEGVQRLYDIDLMALASYDQITHKDDNKLSLGYLTIVGAYLLKGSSLEVATLIDLAVVDPATRSLVLRAGGTDRQHGTSTLVDEQRDSRRASATGFDVATEHMIGKFDTELTRFEADIRAGKANVRVVRRNRDSKSGGGAGSFDFAGILGLLMLALVRMMHAKLNKPAQAA
jgi:rhombotail lipoprotein